MHLPISLIIPTMNRPESLDRTLKFIAEADTPKQIIIIDQSQKEEYLLANREVVNKYHNAFENVVVKYQEIPSLTKARNYGYTFVTEEIVVFSDDDVDVRKDTFANIWKLMQNECLAMIAGIDELTERSDTNIGYVLGTKSFKNRKIGHVTNSMLGRYPDEIMEQITTQWAQGYFFVVRKSLMDRWGIRWDENLTSYAYAEDLDFSYGYYKHACVDGCNCVLDPSVKVKHLATLEFRIPSVKSTYMYIINRAYLSHKHKMGPTGRLASSWCNFWRFVQCLINRQDAKTFLSAIMCEYKYRNEIYAGYLDYDKFMNNK